MSTYALNKVNLSWSSLQDFTSENVRRYVPTSGGVYLLWVKLQSGKWRCYYAGQGANLEERLLDHLNSSELNACIKNHVSQHINAYCYTSVAKQSDRDGIEKYLYDVYNPECNHQDPGGTPIPVNLP